jgi:hypothetical protein
MLQVSAKRVPSVQRHSPWAYASIAVFGASVAWYVILSWYVPVETEREVSVKALREGVREFGPQNLLGPVGWLGPNDIVGLFGAWGLTAVGGLLGLTQLASSLRPRTPIVLGILLNLAAAFYPFVRVGLYLFLGL